MKTEDEELLLKDLCARLPYGFIVHRYSDNCDITFKRNELDEFAHFLEYSEGEVFKPYLRPMSSMTEEEKKEYGKVCELDTEILSKHPMDETPFPALYNSQDWLNKHHFDYRGLIPMGLALEVPEGMYKTK